MAEEKLENQGESKEPEVKKPEDNYIDVINKMKENTVSKDDYDKLLKDNKQLLDSLVNGQKIEPTPTEKKVDVNALRNDIFTKDMNNLQFVQSALDLRKALMDNGEMDPFLPHGHKLTPIPEDYEAADRVAQVFQECIDKSEGNSEIFTAQLMSHMDDVKLPKRTPDVPKKAYNYD